LYVAERENEVIGYVVGFPLRGGLGFCLQIGVLPSAQGQGTGARLMQCIENRMRDLGVTHLYAHTIKENSLYYFTTRLGYQEILRMSILALIYKKL
jgi:N-acetylglutamate synthase-like GNAT family acetyltransferase